VIPALPPIAVALLVAVLLALGYYFTRRR